MNPTLNGVDPVRLVPYDASRLDDLVPQWRAAFEAAVGIIDPHPLAEQRDFFLTKVLPNHAVRLAMLGDAFAGFVAASTESVNQLHVFRGFQRRGIGTRMLDWAKSQSGGTLWLYAFARNEGACRFYERQGFVAVERGFEPHWKLDDVRYAWSRGTDGP